MSALLKECIKQIIPHGLCEYSIRRHDFLQRGFSNRDASWIALSRRRYEAYCDARLNLLPQKITDRMRVCVDAGANIGNWTACLLDLFEPARVLALECEPRLVEALRNRFRSTPQVTVIDSALAGGRGRAQFHRLQHPAGSSLLRLRPEITKEFERNSWDVVGEIPVNTIGYDELVASEPEVSILKLDIQGAEKAVLLNSESGVKKTKAIIIEMNFTPHYYDEGGFAELHQLLVQKGFGLYRLSSPYHRGGRVLFSDGAYVREDLLQGEAGSSN